MLDFKARKQSELDRLLGDGIRASNNRLARDDGCRRRQRDHRQQSPVRIEQEKGVFDRLRIRKHEGTLTEIVDRQRRQRHAEPCGADRPFAKMTEVGIERLGAGNNEKDRAQRHKSDHSVGQQKAQTVDRIEGQQHRGISRYLRYARARDSNEPDECDRSEKRCNFGGAARLHGKQGDQNQRCYWNDIGIEGRRCQLEALDG